MESIELIIIFRFILSVLFLVTGFCALIIGASLYRSGVGLSQDGTTVDIRKIKGTFKTVGSVVMMTSPSYESPYEQVAEEQIKVLQEEIKRLGIKSIQEQIKTIPEDKDQTDNKRSQPLNNPNAGDEK